MVEKHAIIHVIKQMEQLNSRQFRMSNKKYDKPDNLYTALLNTDSRPQYEPIKLAFSI